MESDSEYTVQFGHQDDPRIKTGIEGWKEFGLSGPWRDIKVYLEDRMLVVQREMQVVEELPQMLRLQQEFGDIEFFLALPGFLSAQRVQQDEEDSSNEIEEPL